MIAEREIRTAAKLYEMRDVAKRVLGNKYADHMAECRKVIEIVQSKLKLDNPLAAVTRVCKELTPGGFEVVFFMAAACEMIEPSSSEPQSGQPDGT